MNDVVDTAARAREAARLRASRWYLVRDDEVGGWAVATVDRPTSTQDVDAGDRTMFYAVWEELGRDVVDAHNAAVDRAAVDASPGFHGRPAALDAPPSSDRSYLAWADLRDGPSGTSWAVCHAYAVRVATVSAPDGELGWVTEDLAVDVAPPAAARLVDGLRALRAVRGDAS
jgi:hypothetical protein